MKVWTEMKPSLFLFKVSTRHIINKLFFDIAPEEDGTPVDPESLQVIKNATEFIQCSEYIEKIALFYCSDFRMSLIA